MTQRRSAGSTATIGGSHAARELDCDFIAERAILIVGVVARDRPPRDGLCAAAWGGATRSAVQQRRRITGASRDDHDATHAHATDTDVACVARPPPGGVQLYALGVVFVRKIVSGSLLD